jgi:hypothetical protein
VSEQLMIQDQESKMVELAYPYDCLTCYLLLNANQ